MRRLSFVSILAVGLGTLAHAAPSLGSASTFNAFIFNNYSMKSDSDGPIAAGGALTGSQNINMHGFSGTLGNTTGIDVYGGLGSSVGGNLDGSGGSVYLQGGSFSANNNAHATVNIGANSTLSTAFTAEENFLKGVSGGLDTLPAYSFNVNWTNNNGNNALFLYGSNQQLSLGTAQNPTFDFTNVAANFTQSGVGYIVLDISASELSSFDSHANNVTWEGLGATKNLILNINGGGQAVTWSPQQQTNADTAYTLYNFVNTPTVSTTQQFTGSILAVNSTLDQGNGNIQGNIIANNFNQAGEEIHFGTDGNGNYLGSVPTPEPAPFAALGLGALIVLRRRKKA